MGIFLGGLLQKHNLQQPSFRNAPFPVPKGHSFFPSFLTIFLVPMPNVKPPWAAKKFPGPGRLLGVVAETKSTRG